MASEISCTFFGATTCGGTARLAASKWRGQRRGVPRIGVEDDGSQRFRQLLAV
jgi:hypothetical protein